MRLTKALLLSRYESALTLIQQLQAENARLAEQNDQLLKTANQVKAEYTPQPVTQKREPSKMVSVTREGDFLRNGDVLYTGTWKETAKTHRSEFIANGVHILLVKDEDNVERGRIPEKLANSLPVRA